MAARIRDFRITHLRALSVALLALIFSAGLAFGGEPQGPPADAAVGLENAAVHAGKVLPVRTGLQDVSDEESEPTPEDEDLEDVEEEETEEEETEEVEDLEDGENCATDPTTLTEEELAAMKHGSIVCWAAHQDTWPEEFKNHGQWVSSWAKAKAPNGDEEAGATATGQGKGKAKGRAES